MSDSAGIDPIEEVEIYSGSTTEDDFRGSSSSSDTSSTAETHVSAGSDERAKETPAPMGWPMQKNSIVADELASDPMKDPKGADELKYSLSEVELMKERFSKLLLGEDMSGSGKGVCAALAISNAITNLCATIFGQLWRLEPLPPEKKSMWRREIEVLLCVSDQIVELIPSWQTFPDGSKLEVMTCRPRTDLCINLPALRKLDRMLIEILDNFSDPEFWYVDQGIVAQESDGKTLVHRREEKWWLPVPRVPPGGLPDNSRKQLHHKRECANQILKAAMAINSIALAEMEVPEPYLNLLPKNGRTSLGDLMYRYISSDQFAPDCLLDCLDLSSEHQALEVANRVEAAIYVWRKQTEAKHIGGRSNTAARSSWSMVKDMIMDVDRRELFAERAESLLLCLKQRFPGLTQTTLDTSKIQFNKDIGKSIMESYSRVLESLAFNIVARIDELIHVDDLCKHSDQLDAKVSLIGHTKGPFPFLVPPSGTPYMTAYGTPSFSPAPLKPL